jgi:hypothetical protein
VGQAKRSPTIEKNVGESSETQPHHEPSTEPKHRNPTTKRLHPEKR